MSGSGSRKWLLWLAIGGGIVLLAAGAGMWWRTSSANADSKAMCMANQRLIESAAYAYVQDGPPHTMADLDGPVDDTSPLTVAEPNADPQLPPPVPRCPDRFGEPYILKDGLTECPVHGTYE